jgi:hypothetical protein
MKKADNFDASKWLVENKITFQSRLNENEEFSDDFPSLDYNTITNFIKSKGYKITSYYYDGGFDVNDGEYFIGVFDDHIAVTDGNGQVKDIPFNESRLNEDVSFPYQIDDERGKELYTKYNKAFENPAWKNIDGNYELEIDLKTLLKITGMTLDELEELSNNYSDESWSIYVDKNKSTVTQTNN